MRLFNSLKSVKKRTFLSFLGVIKAPAGHSESFVLSKISSFTNRSTSSFTDFKNACGIGYVFLNHMAWLSLPVQYCKVPY